MRIGESLRRGGRPQFSFEFFPPKSDDGVAALLDTIETLKVLSPSFVSVTYGAGGSTRARTVEIAKRIKRDVGIEVLAHITCVGHSVDELRGVFREVESAGIENVLALRGDPPGGQLPFVPSEGGFRYASDLVALLRDESGFSLGAAVYPEVHPEALSAEADLDNALRKVRAGAEFLITQLFFDNDAYFRFVDRARAAGIDVPIVPGIMPIASFAQAARMTQKCAATIPPRLQAALEASSGDPDSVAALGVAYAALQCTDLLERGVPGIHFITLNRSPATRAVVSALIAGGLLEGGA